MIVQQFSRSHPIQFMMGFLLLAITVIVYALQGGVDNYYNLAAFTLIAAASLLVIKFITSKNELELGSNLCFLIALSLYLATIPYWNWESMLGNLFLLLALRRVYAIRTGRELLKKLFEAGFWLTLAAICSSASVAFAVLIPAAILLYTQGNFRNWVVPLLGATTVVILGLTLTSTVWETWGLFPSVVVQVPSVPAIPQRSLLLAVIGLLCLLSVPIYMAFAGRITQLQRRRYWLTLIVLLVAVLQYLFLAGSSLLCLALPLGIVLSVMLQNIKLPLAGDLVLAILIGLAIYGVVGTAV